MTHLDELDQNIIKELQINGRVTNSAIAKKYECNEGTIRQRIKKLIDSELIKVAAQINPEKIPHYQILTLGISVTESRNLTRVADELTRLPEVNSVAITAGRYDILLELLLTQDNTYINFLTKSLSKIDGIARSESFMQVRTYNRWL